MRAAVI